MGPSGCINPFALCGLRLGTRPKDREKFGLSHETHPLRPGSVAVIPAGVLHSLEASVGQELEFVIFGTPPMSIDDELARPRKG